MKTHYVSVSMSWEHICDNEYREVRVRSDSNEVSSRLERRDTRREGEREKSFFLSPSPSQSGVSDSRSAASTPTVVGTLTLQILIRRLGGNELTLLYHLLYLHFSCPTVPWLLIRVFIRSRITRPSLIEPFSTRFSRRSNTRTQVNAPGVTIDQTSSLIITLGTGEEIKTAEEWNAMTSNVYAILLCEAQNGGWHTCLFSTLLSAPSTFEIAWTFLQGFRFSKRLIGAGSGTRNVLVSPPPRPRRVKRKRRRKETDCRR